MIQKEMDQTLGIATSSRVFVMLFISSLSWFSKNQCSDKYVTLILLTVWNELKISETL